MTLTLGILSALTAFFGIVREVLRRRNTPKSTLTPKQSAEVEAHKARHASAEGNSESVNARMERYRLRKNLAFVGLAGMLFSGCAFSHSIMAPEPDLVTVPSVVVVSADRWQYPMTNSVGVSGWFVPAAVHADFMESIELIEYYKTKEKTK
jgi:hypothetical protein